MIQAKQVPGEASLFQQLYIFISQSIFRDVWGSRVSLLACVPGKGLWARSGAQSNKHEKEQEEKVEYVETDFIDQ